MRSIFSILLMLILCLSIVAAQDEETVQALQGAFEQKDETLQSALEVDTEGLTEDQVVQVQKTLLIAQLDTVQVPELPKLFKKLFGDERVNIYLEGGDTIAVVTEKGEVTELKEGTVENPTAEVTISDNVFKAANAGTFDFRKALKGGDITIKGMGIWNKMRFGVYNAALHVASWF